MKPFVILGLIVAGVAALITGAVAPPRSTGAVLPASSLPVGHESPLPGATFVRGWNVADIGPCPFQQAYATLQLLLGDPVGPFTGRSQDFQYGRLLCLPANPPERRVLLDDLGLAHLRLSGLLPQPGSEPHPAGRAHLVGALETGLDPLEIYGRVISPPLCDRERRCRQYTDKQLLLFEDRPDTLVTWAPLGCWLNHGCNRAMAEASDAVGSRTNEPLRWVLVALGAVALGAAVVLLALGRQGSGRTRVTI